MQHAPGVLTPTPLSEAAGSHLTYGDRMDFHFTSEGQPCCLVDGPGGAPMHGEKRFEKQVDLGEIGKVCKDNLHENDIFWRQAGRLNDSEHKLKRPSGLLPRTGSLVDAIIIEGVLSGNPARISYNDRVADRARRARDTGYGIDKPSPSHVAATAS